jgi:predicted TIM-barrel fold metal-dependent hydrolase
MRSGHFVVDAHTHISPHPHFHHGRDGRLTSEAHIERMDRYGLDVAVVIAHAWAGWTLSQYQREHDLIAAEVMRHPDRFIGFCWTDPHLGTEAVKEFERCVTQLGYRGLKFHPVYQRFNFDDPIIYPLIERAEEFGVPVVAHLDLQIPGCEPWRMVNLAKRFPNVQFIMAHMGRDIQAIQDLSIGRIPLPVPNLILEGSSTTSDAYGTFQGPATILGPTRIIFGSDAAPFHHPAINLLKIDLLDMPDEWKALILGGNMVRVLTLNVADFGRAPDYSPGVFETPRGRKIFACPDPAIARRLVAANA